MLNEYNSSATVENCIFDGNTAAASGGAACTQNTSLTEFLNCTSVNNSAPLGGALYSSGASATNLSTCILWNNADEAIGSHDTSITTISYSDVQEGFPGEGNMSVDPRFVDGDTGDFRLQWGSPCIDKATSIGAPVSDVLGVSRPQGDGVDMGAYEFLLIDEDGDGMDDRW